MSNCTLKLLELLPERYSTQEANTQAGTCVTWMLVRGISLKRPVPGQEPPKRPVPAIVLSGKTIKSKLGPNVEFGKLMKSDTVSSNVKTRDEVTAEIEDF